MVSFRNFSVKRLFDSWDFTEFVTIDWYFIVGFKWFLMDVREQRFSFILLWGKHHQIRHAFWKTYWLQRCQVCFLIPFQMIVLEQPFGFALFVRMLNKLLVHLVLLLYQVHHFTSLISRNMLPDGSIDWGLIWLSNMIRRYQSMTFVPTENEKHD